MRKPTEKELDEFLDYRSKHVSLVQKLGKIAFDIDLSNHDEDKINAVGKELDLMAMRNASKGKDLRLSDEDKRELEKVSARHAKSQKHHAEYWDDTITIRNFKADDTNVIHASKMPKRYLMEMACDWVAVALYKNASAFDWFNKVVDETLLLTDNQREFLKKCLIKLDKVVRKNDIRYPFKDYDADKGELKESMDKKTVVMTFARMNPCTTGHMETVIKALHETDADEKRIYLSHTQDKPNKKDVLKNKNPLPYQLKVLYLKEALKGKPYKVDVMETPAKTVIEALIELNKEGFGEDTDVLFVCGSDRVDQFREILTKYNGYFTDDGVGYKFNSIDFILAGERIDDGDGIQAMSASKMRKFAVEDNFEEFREGCPIDDDFIAREEFDDIRRYMLG